jgi:hypothetical protein
MMVRSLGVAILAAIFLSPFACPRGALAWSPLSYEEAAWMCGIGNLQACDFMYAYEMNGLLADPWVNPGVGGSSGVRHGPPSRQ